VDSTTQFFYSVAAGLSRGGGETIGPVFPGPYMFATFTTGLTKPSSTKTQPTQIMRGISATPATDRLCTYKEK
jgi:hypothetical protein